MGSSLKKKIVDRDELLSVVHAARQAGKTIAQCHGCFDIVHPGHIRYLEFARQQGDVLIVSLTGDAESADDAIATALDLVSGAVARGGRRLQRRRA